MVISSIVLLYATYVLLGVFVLFSLFNLFHTLRFGLIGYSGLFVSLAYLVVATVLISHLFELIQSHDWTETLTLPFGSTE